MVTANSTQSRRHSQLLIGLVLLVGCFPTNGLGPLPQEEGSVAPAIEPPSVLDGTAGMEDGSGGMAGGDGDGDGDVVGDGDGDGDGDGSGGSPGDGDAPGDGDGDVFDAGTDRDRNRVAPGEICERLAVIQCAGESYCCSRTRTVESCEAIANAYCRDESLLDAIAVSSVTGFDAAHAEAAFTQFEQMVSECDPAITSWVATRDGLAGMFTGTMNQGDSCAPQNPTNPGRHAVAAALASCVSASTHACLPADYTLMPDPRTAWRCEPRSGNGGICYSDANCRDDLYCDNPGLQPTAICTPRLENGSNCTQANQCASLTCQSSSCVAADIQTAYCLIP